MRVFLDVGAHTGETVLEVAKPRYRFDRIVCFEPASACISALDKLNRQDSRIEVCPFGLAGTTRTQMLYAAGTVAGSIFETEGRSERVELVDVAEWLRQNVNPTDFIVAKTNCEGGEIDIVNRLLDAGLMEWFYSFLITFDIRNYPEHRHEEAQLRKKLAASGLSNFCFSDDVMIGTTHEARLARWLGLFGIDREGGDYSSNFRRYSSMSGRRHRAEQRLKEMLGYAALPEPAKDLLRSAKRALGLSRERDSR